MTRAGTEGRGSRISRRSAGRIRIICLGLSALDQVWRVDRFFSGQSEKIRSLDYATLGGGMAANAAVTVARLGGAIAFWGRGGDDAAGREMRTALAAEGVDVANFRLFPDGRSSVSGIIVDSSGERQIVNFRGPFPEAADWLPLDEVAQASAVLADPRWVEGAVALFGKARALGIPTVLDGDVADAEVFERLLPLTDHAIFSEPALAAFAGSADDAALDKLARFNCRVIAVTRGGEGRELVRERPPAAPRRLSRRRRRHHGRRRCLPRRLRRCDRRRPRACTTPWRSPSAAAALKCTRSGGRAGIPSINDCLAFMRTHQ